MSRIFVIPDVHLKPWIFEKASVLVDKDAYDAVVMLGDLVDDWYQEKNIDLYNETFDAAIAFTSKHSDTFWCFGNHDVSYIWKKLESGYSSYAEPTVRKRFKDLQEALPPENSGFIFKFDDTLFSHAGLTEKFVKKHFNKDDGIDYILTKINKMGPRNLWEDSSPIWARPHCEGKLYSNLFQIVGHTPVRTALEEGNLLTLDNFSTYRDSRPIGDERFVWVDTIEKAWGFAEDQK